MSQPKAIFRKFTSDVQSIALPTKFTFPFYYEPHPLTILAAEELQRELSTHPLIAPLFDTEDENCLPTGKMFGVLVVKNEKGELGYLAGFSGKLGSHTDLEGYVPLIFDLWNENGFFAREDVEVKAINAINAKIEKLEADTVYSNAKALLKQQIAEEKTAIEEKKVQHKKQKNERKAIRKEQEVILSPEEFQLLNDDLVKQSLRDKYELRVLTEYWQEQITTTRDITTSIEEELNNLKEERKQKSNGLQQKLFASYKFLNYKGEEQSLLEIFEKTVLQQPPAAAGDCAAPKLMQYAYEHNYTPIALGEFWWGESPKSEIRKHQHFYPSCRSKCEPILGHMLEGLEVDDNPLLINPALNRPIEVVYEDEYFAIVNKPEDFLSVPGIYILDSVYERMKLRYPNATGPLIVHRLDMPTSGILIIAKDKDSHKALQSQFIKKSLEKRYVAILDGIIAEDEGIIELPLRIDFDDRPRQMVCYEYGKYAKTRYEVIERKDGKTKVYFYPITGRTHQLRMHASHPKGLNTPIVGDDLYGTKADRLYLHAERITFRHPKTYELMTFTIKESF
ncbi:ribosomal large subunit pseudouridine synthase A [Myroides odoratimimus]|uniref:RluA family pseudouridine synthase n=1 Tax=Myroides odoratimimus CCUG 10230 TaxID=883150 RepID=A0ABN0EDY1_9FLAO|nr:MULTISPECIES: RluA family pseudouridine synthase [Myroides]AJA69305.1 Pseudouridylate synthase, 23S RNA-specific [Myroides sp. A21]EHO11978.1 RluA family pseudouridine synthase [Myroides odoratimimus CCUG 10230]MDM1455852.1 RluA family pseudouridine synthase [Myroides odoratimimus]MDM1499925.1 RluA family pseudouridine synthase [Myroides odoratimimus]MDM1507225.1 RluA family pseudouridine synthase [Myroides odoratimimus]